MQYNRVTVKWWVKAILFTAFLYSVVWGFITMIAPDFVFVSSGLDKLIHHFPWQMVGLLELLLGVGFLVAMFDPYKHWLLILLGFVYKFFSPLVFFIDAGSHKEILSLSNVIIVDNILWLPFLGAILYQVYRHAYNKDSSLIDLFNAEEFTLDMFDTSAGVDLLELTDRQPTMVVFLRHFGCTFCRETLSELAKIKNDIRENGTQLVLVHMLEDEDKAHEQIALYNLNPVITISDPEAILYKKFNLKRGTLMQLLGPKTLFRGFLEGLVYKHGLNMGLGGDVTQMPGIFLLYKGKVIKRFVHDSSSDRPPYLELSKCSDCETVTASAV